MLKRKSMSVFLLLLIVIIGCSKGPSLNIPFEKLVLDNGLEVILHEDKSDPTVAVAVLFHVGSNREEKGKTGLAHLFEHITQNIGQNQFHKRLKNAGGNGYGQTSQDGTYYMEQVPKNALEMVLWMESNRMGYLLSKVTKDAFLNQQNVVLNEKRQRVDNRPYGHTDYVISKMLYPDNHPYNWRVIGSMEDLTNATLKDVHDFHQKWYRPNNATLVVAGDYDRRQTLDWIEKYFGEIESGEKVEDFAPIPNSLQETKRAFHEDNFAKSPDLNMVFPTLEQLTDDAYALNYLGKLLAGGKNAPLYKVIVEEKKLAPSVSGYNGSRELAGSFRIRVRTFPEKNLTDVEQAIFEAFQKFETEKFTEKDLDRIKAKLETRFYNQISSILRKSSILALFNEYTGSAGYITTHLKRIRAVTSDDIWRVYNQYIKDKHYVLTSFVPKGQTNLAAENSYRFPIQEESVKQQVEVTEVKGEDLKIDEIPSSFDRSVEPPKGPDPLLTLPKVWSQQFANDLQVYGIHHDELPLLRFSLTLKGGMLLDDPEKIGVANLITEIMMEGTKNKTPIELEEAIDELGASISMYTTKESIVLEANCLTSKFQKVFQLTQEILFEPRWDENEFTRIKDETIETIKRTKVNPRNVAREVFNNLVYGKKHKLANSTLGTESTVQTITLEDLKTFYESNFSPNVAYLVIAGDISQSEAVKIFQPLRTEWESKEVRLPELPKPKPINETRIYFVDFPNAKQSEIRAGHLALPYTHPDFYKATVMNLKLGGDAIGNLFLILREEKGFTYNARSYFSGTHYPGTFSVSTAVRSTATLESVQIIKEEIRKYRQGISDEDIQLTKNKLIKFNANRFEDLEALMTMLEQMAGYDLDSDYIKTQEDIVRNMSSEDHKALALKYIQPNQMIYLVAGDAKTQMEALSKIGYGTPILLDEEGNKK
ncbi:M16 family metallopeptidase [Bacteroidota bacterium]